MRQCGSGWFRRGTLRTVPSLPWWTTVFVTLLLFDAQAADRTRTPEEKELQAPAAQGEWTPLERSLIAEALSAHGLVVHPDPEGRRIDEIVVYVAPVFDHRDPVPDWFNVFHARTRNFIIAQEVLVQRGQRWETGRVLETERNLREIRQLSLANVVPTKKGDGDELILLVVVKDVWSLRLNSDIAVGNSGLDYLVLNPTEENLAGLRATLGAWFILQRDRYYVGGNVGAPRLGTTRYGVSLSGGVYRNRFSGELEGSQGSFAFFRPQFSRHTRFAYGVSAAFHTEVTRQYREGRIAQERVELKDGTVETMPWVYDSETLTGNYWFRRSWFVENKVDIEWGIDVDHRRFATQDQEFFSSEAVEVFEQEFLPVDDTRLSPYVELSLYETRFLRTSGIESLGFQEDHRLGYGVGTTVFAAAAELGSTRDLVGVRSNLGFTWQLGNGLFRLSASQRLVASTEGRHEGHVHSAVRFVSPSSFFGRLHLDGALGLRTFDHLNVTPFFLGGNNRLRGYPANTCEGKSIGVANAEFRSTGFEVLSAQVGAAVFYDLGGTSGGCFEAREAIRDRGRLSDFDLRQSAGMGLRIVFPQAERIPFRIDWGLPLSGDVALLPGGFFFTFGQAFPLPAASGGGSILGN